MNNFDKINKILFKSKKKQMNKAKQKFIIYY